MAQRQHQKSQERFDALFAKAGSLVGAINPARVAADDYSKFRAGAEHFLPAVHAAPSVWTKHRFYAFSVFMMRPQDKTQDQIDAITEDFINNEEEPPHFRALAGYWVAIWYTKLPPQLNYTTAAEFLRHSLDIIAASPEEDENRQVLYEPYITAMFHFSGHALGSNDLTLKRVLGLMEQKIREQLLECNDVETTTPVAGNPDRQANYQRLQDRAFAGGKVCDCCGKTLEELKLTSFKRCARCTMAFYCSPECHREHWKKKGHKQACREKGQIEIGDDMLLTVRNEHGELNLLFVKVISSVGGDQWWQVMYHGGTEDVVTVNGDHLARIRPPSTL